MGGAVEYIKLVVDFLDVSRKIFRVCDRLQNYELIACEAEYELVIFGDTNGDGDINSSDVTDIRMMNAGREDLSGDT